MTAIAIIHRLEIIEQVAQGKLLKQIAAKYGISANAISKVLKDDPDYLAVKEAYHSTRLDDAEEMIEGALDQVDVARARAVWTSRSWRAEREMSSIWGTKPTTVVIDNSGPVSDRVKEMAASLLSEMRVVEEQAPSDDAEQDAPD